MFVSPDYRGQKIGSKLVERALQFCEEVGYEFVFRTTSRMTQAIELCKKNGFVQRAKIQLGPIELFKFVRPLHPLNK
jgi:GNAT superfamily N-acetyltransferase